MKIDFFTIPSPVCRLGANAHVCGSRCGPIRGGGRGRGLRRRRRREIIQDPAALLTATIKGQTIESMVVINVATVTSLLQTQPGGAPAKDILANLSTGGGTEDIPFLKANANVATVFATFWLETIKGSAPGQSSLQLQYVQTVFLDFPVITPGNPPGANLSWPHVSVATLQKVFGGQ